MIRRFYVHNFRCLENFELPIADRSSVLLIGKNGVGKSTVGLALRILQKIARGVNRIGELVLPKDLALDRAEVPMRFELEVILSEKLYAYVIALELPPKFKELRVREERLTVDGKLIFGREAAEVRLLQTDQDKEASFRIDWHLAALPIIQERTHQDALFLFKEWLASMVILHPLPSLMVGSSSEETLRPSPSVENFGAWFSGLLASAPAAYGEIDRYLREVMPDFKDIKNPTTGTDSRSLEVQFSNGLRSSRFPFSDLSDGEKCYMLCAMVLAANHAYGPLVCFWDEPDNHLALSEVGQFVLALRKSFLAGGGQFIATSHHPEAIRRFSEENTILLHRANHLEPTQARLLKDVKINGDLINSLLRDDVQP